MEEGFFVQPVTYIGTVNCFRKLPKQSDHDSTLAQNRRWKNVKRLDYKPSKDLPVIFPTPLPLELASNALSNKRHIGPAAIAIARRRLGQLVGRVKPARAPPSPPQVHVRVAVQHIQLLAHGFQAARIIRSTTGLGEDRLALVRAQPVAQRREGLGVVGRARRVRARVVRVEVLVHVEDQVRRSAVEVSHFD
jgi:hypothetical protein